jgi:hypothetical protein
VFSRADLAKVIPASKKTAGAAAKPQAAATPPNPAADADASDGEPSKTASSRRPASAPKGKKSNTNSTS